MAELEQKCMFIHGFQPSFISKITQHLQLKQPNYHPDDAFSVKDVFEAAQFILQGLTFFPVDMIAPMAPVPNRYTQLTSTPQVKEEMLNIKTEDFYSMLNKTAQTAAESVTALVVAIQTNPGVPIGSVVQPTIPMQ